MGGAQRRAAVHSDTSAPRTRLPRGASPQRGVRRGAHTSEGDSVIPFANLRPYVELVRGPDMAQDTIEDVAKLLDSCEFIGGGPTVQRFESALTEKLKIKHAIACANGTDALQLALRACGIERGHRVAIPNLTFWATLEAVVNVGATPVLLDIDDSDLQMNFEEFVRAHRQHRFNAAILVHLYGWCSSKLDLFRGYCRDKRLTLIEDGAQAFGVNYGEQSVFADADIATLSFYPAKVLGAIGDAGAVVTPSPRLAARVRALANHGRAGHYEHAVTGWNSRMDAIQAAWLLRALKVIDKVIDERRRLVRAYGGPRTDHTMIHPAGSLGNGYLQVSMVGDAAGVVRRLNERGVEARRVYPLTLADQSGGKAAAIPVGDLPVSRSVAERIISLPLWYGMTDKDIECCADALREVGGAAR